MYVFDGLTVVLVVPSPKFQRYVNVSPLGSVELTPGNVHVRTTHTGVLITATGGWLDAGSAIVMVRVVVAALPQVSVTVSVTV